MAFVARPSDIANWEQKIGPMIRLMQDGWSVNAAAKKAGLSEYALAKLRKSHQMFDSYLRMDAQVNRRKVRGVYR